MGWETWIGGHPLAVDVQADGSLRWHLFAQGDREAEGPPLLSAPAGPLLADGLLETVKAAGGVTFLDGGPPVQLSYEDCRQLVGLLAACESCCWQLLDVLRERVGVRAEVIRVQETSDVLPG